MSTTPRMHSLSDTWHGCAAGTVEYHTTFFNPNEHKMARARRHVHARKHTLTQHAESQVFDLFSHPSYNGYMASSYKNYTINWTPQVQRPQTCMRAPVRFARVC